MAKLTQTISRDFHAADDRSLSDYGLKLQLGFNNNPAYPTPTPALAPSLQLLRDFNDAIAAAMGGGTVATARKNDLKQQVMALLDAWCDYALATTPANILAWQSAGFRLTKDSTTPAQPLTPPAVFTLADGSQSGSVAVSQSAQLGSRAYVVEYALLDANDQPGPWQYCLSSTSNCEISGLARRSEYLFRAGAWNGTTDPAFCPAKARIVQ